MDSERHADHLDRAAFISEVSTADAVESIRRAAAPEQRCVDGKWETEDCVDCDEPIEPARLAMGKIRCVACQTLLEGRRRVA